MPSYLIRWPDRPELVEADSVRVEGIHQVLRGTALVIGQPREIVVRRVPRHVLVEALQEASPGRPQAQERPEGVPVLLSDATPCEPVQETENGL